MGTASVTSMGGEIPRDITTFLSQNQENDKEVGVIKPLGVQGDCIIMGIMG